MTQAKEEKEDKKEGNDSGQGREDKKEGNDSGQGRKRE